jgi:hypothetical protein
MVKYETMEREEWALTVEGKEIAEHGSHEAKVFAMVPPGEEGALVVEIQVKGSLGLCEYLLTRKSWESRERLVWVRPFKINGSRKRIPLGSFVR